MSHIAVSIFADRLIWNYRYCGPWPLGTDDNTERFFPTDKGTFAVQKSTVASEGGAVSVYEFFMLYRGVRALAEVKKIHV